MTSSHIACSYLATLLACALPAQADTPDPAAETQIRTALEKTRRLGSIAFKSVETRDDAMLRQLPVPGQEDVQVSGSVSGGVLHASIGLDDDEVLIADGRMAARRQNGTWKLRRGCLVTGKPLPFVLDPKVMLGALADLPAGALRPVQVEAGKLKDKDVTTYGLHFAGETAEELTLCGVLPRPAAGPVMVMIGGGHDDPPKSEVTVDLAVTVDATSGFVVRVHSKTYSKSELPGNFQVRIADGNGVEIEQADDDDEAKEKPTTTAAALEFSKGLPKRKLDKKTSLSEFDVSLTQHGTAKAVELTDAAKALLKN